MLCQIRSVALALIGAGFLSLPATPTLAQQKNPERNVYYGETHLHTSWSFDAFAFGDTLTGPGGFLPVRAGQARRSIPVASR